MSSVRFLPAGSMCGGSHAEVAERTPQIAIGISENELTVAHLGWSFHLPAAAALSDSNPVPALLDRHKDADVEVMGGLFADSGTRRV